jgi:hypothetical protein
VYAIDILPLTMNDFWSTLLYLLIYPALPSDLPCSTFWSTLLYLIYPALLTHGWGRESAQTHRGFPGTQQSTFNLVHLW